MNVAATGLSRAKIRELTKYVRKISGYAECTYFPIVEFIELVLGDPDNPDFNYEIVEPWEMEDMYGNTNTRTNVMKIRKDVYERAVRGVPRDRFTLCHELGHYLMHRPETMSYPRGKVPRYCQPEWQANTFAGELMAPYDLVKNMGIKEIMEIVECLDKQLQFNIMNIINDVSSSKSFIHRKNQAHKTLGTYRKKLYQLLRSAIFSLDKLSIARYSSFWQVKLRKERVLCI